MPSVFNVDANDVLESWREVYSGKDFVTERHRSNMSEGSSHEGTRQKDQ